MTEYKKAGVDIQAGDQFVEDISGLVSKTRRPEVLADIGGYAGLFELKKYKNPVLVSSTDGVGTKVILANQLKSWKGIGVDCVAMCVNDIGCFGAEPLFFLDYLASAQLDRAVLKQVVAGMAEACREVGCSLLGGETAEMPGVYPPGEFDCAGFAVGVLEKDQIVDGKTIRPGDAVIGVASSGFHSNGYSLIRRIVKEERLNLQMLCSETHLSLAQTLLLPTKLYTPLILKLKKEVLLKGIAHITGGGLVENPPRILPQGTAIEIRAGAWPVPEYMEMFRVKGGLDHDEFHRVFNCGVGLVLVVSPSEKEAALRAIDKMGEKAWAMGQIVEGKIPEVHFLY
ncbi:MAG: phosphoribosylformylglycinamidine cyclo-ligase [Deltaproteobacteria bacterium]|nr:phosphoribosylformylglycinamidine cyclo-ligase [Deltaproteobacteria bacterium]